MRTIITLMTIISFYHFSLGQAVQTDTLAQQEIIHLGFLTGRWAGSGWMMGPDGQKQIFTQSENIEFKLDSTLLLIEGIGKSEGKPIHHALAVVSFNSQDHQYSFQSYLSDGRNGNFKAELIDEKLYWYPNENIRYIIGLNKEGQWFEIGQMKRNAEWIQFFEMTLVKTE